MMGLPVVAVLLAASVLDLARAAYESGDLAQARTQLEALLYPLSLEGDALEAEAHLLLAATYHAQEDPRRAENEVVRGLAAVEGPVRLDPLQYPPDFIAFVERVRTAQAERIAALAVERRPRLIPESRPVASAANGATSPKGVTPAAMPAPSRAWYLAPLGVGHFRHGRPAAGTALAVTQGVCLAVSGASLGTALAMRGPDGRYSAAEASTARALNVAWVAGAYAFLAAYAYGVVDGMLLEPSPPTP
ncbi:hypothetical protein KRR26_09820 [Corallococcus sp. M34]|uniref:tetratricopeptide repeat protein n=1 Tax=Citreicoccus inhibens TaxID=2849499 RepID=UPI001C224E8D|nr:hypothetical protein [Citreicoccus inhibens]MBU8895903.1 hypothetical protein [Citreicoccus inhibens]